MAVKTKKPKALRVKTLSSLLAIGLRDLRKQERAKDSRVNMGTWYECNGECTVCLAGSVLRFSMGLGRVYGTFSEDEFGVRISNQLCALNSLREGFVDAARYWITNRFGDETLNRDMPPYDGPKGEWWAAMKQLHADLIAAGE